MPEIAFYRHTRGGVDETLPILLEKSLARGWRVVVQAASPTRLARLDEHLWAYRGESFLPHGTRDDGDAQMQPIFLTCGDDNPNDADARFFLERVRIAPALVGAAAPRERAVLMFNGEDADEVEDARAQWKELRDAGFALICYQQNEAGGWIETAREPKPAAAP